MSGARRSVAEEPVAGESRPIPMRRHHGTAPLSTLATVLLTATLLSGCGEESSSPTSSAGESSPGRGESADAVTLSEPPTLISATAAGGEVESRATVLADADDLADFSAQFGAESMPQKLEAASGRIDVGADEVLVGAVVWIGCDVPPGVTVTSTESGVEITAEKIVKPLKECFAPVTTVALVSVDADLV